ncbi:MAG: transposase [Burkholderia sp.]
MHVHLSVTCGGVTADGKQWKPLYFVKTQIMPMWRYAIVDLLRQSYEQLILSEGSEGAVSDADGLELLAGSSLQ